MSNLTNAVKALHHVRSRVGGYASDNKKFRDYDWENPTVSAEDGATAYRRHIEHANKSNAIGDLRSHAKNPANATHSKNNITAYGSAVLSAKVGNCLELSCAAASHLGHGLFSPSWDLVKLDGGSDHIFVVVGPPDPAADGAYPQNFATWPADAAVCDVWADIACPVRDFPARWRARIDNWHIMSLQLPGMVGHGFASAAAWRDAIDSPKISYTS